MLPKYVVGELDEDAVKQTITRRFDVEGVTNSKYGHVVPRLYTMRRRHQFAVHVIAVLENKIISVLCPSCRGPDNRRQIYRDSDTFVIGAAVLISAAICRNTCG